MSYIDLEIAGLIYYLIDFIIIAALFVGLRVFSGFLVGTSLHEILSEKDNFAVGIALSGAVFGLAIMLTGAASGDAASTPLREFLLIGSYGLLGVFLLWLTRLMFEHLSLPAISIHRLLLADNVAIGIVDAGNMIASALVVRAVMLWVESSSLKGLLVVLIGFLLSQFLMYLATQYRQMIFARRHPGRQLHDELADGNIALALRFAGHRIGVALAVTATSGLLVFRPDELWTTLVLWLLIALALFAAQTLLAFGLRKVLLPGVNTGAEVVEQRNVAIGTLQASIYIAVGLIFVGLFG